MFISIYQLKDDGQLMTAPSRLLIRYRQAWTSRPKKSATTIPKHSARLVALKANSL